MRRRRATSTPVRHQVTRPSATRDRPHGRGRSGSPACRGRASRRSRMALERRLFDLGWNVYTLDGDNVRTRPQREPRLLARGPPGEHPPRRRGRGAVRRRRPRLRHRVHLAVPRRPHPRARRRGSRAVHRGLGALAARGMRAARPEGPLPEGARRRAQGLHRHRQPVRGARGAGPGASTPSRIDIDGVRRGSCSSSSSRAAATRRVGARAVTAWRHGFGFGTRPEQVELVVRAASRSGWPSGSTARRTPRSRRCPRCPRR